MGLIAGGFYVQGGGTGDTINLQDTGTSTDTQGGPATAAITCYRANHSTRAGEVWNEDNGELFAYDLVTPSENSGSYQLKWDQLSGTAPYSPSSSTEATWIDISTTDFVVTWRLGTGPGTTTGSVTVSMRVGTNPSIIKTAVWDGSVTLSGKGK